MNNFNSKSSCERKCRPGMNATVKPEPDNRAGETNVDHICSLPSSVGSCDGSHERFFYDILTEECQEFNYTGCGGNLNNFFSLNECSEFCRE